MATTRRGFLKMAGATTLGFAGLGMLYRTTAGAATVPSGSAIVDGFGPLKKDPNGILDLPEGFSYKVISTRGDEMNDGLLVPGLPDGMAAFDNGDGLTVIVRNHELNSDDFKNSGYGEDNKLAENVDNAMMYDAGHGTRPGLGGTSTILFDTKAQELKAQRMSLAGTVRNCAGGPTPWQTWITCEETVQRADENHEKDHGYNFEVPADYEKGLVEPKPIEGMGRFNHEAIAVDPKSGIVYQTEDRHDGLIYRYIPNERGNMHSGGKLQALVFKRHKSFDTRNWDAPGLVAVGASFEVEWMDVEDIHSPNDDMRLVNFDKGAARFARGEGMWTGEDGIYFACTNGGHAKKGQIWRYIPSPAEGTQDEDTKPGRVELFVEPNDGGLVDNADNLTVAPWGDLIVCEDGSGDQFLVGVTPQGGIYKFGHNAVSNSEFAGACFSPDGTTLFVNIQHDGLTLAINGPWESARA